MSDERRGNSPPAGGGWFWMDNAVVPKIADIGPLAFATYAVLAKHADKKRTCYPSGKSLRETTGASKQSIYRAIRVLEESELIRVDRSGNVKGVGGNTNNRYTLLPLGPSDKKAPGVPNHPEAQCQESTRPGDKKAPGPVTPEHHEQDPIEQDPSNKTSSGPKLRFEPADLETAGWMLDLIRKILPSFKKPRLETWANTIRLIRERDKKTDADIRDLFARANADPFWRSNVLSPEKLREKWDPLDLKLRGSSHEGNGTGTAGTGGRRPSPVGSDSPARPRQRCLGGA